MTLALQRSVASLAVPNYRRFFAGQLVSVSGKWVQNVAAVWLVLHLSGSGTVVGLTTAAEFLPMLVLGAWGGLLADRVAKRPLLMVTQTLLVLPPLALFALTAAGAIQAWMVIALVFSSGVVTAIDNPARQSFIAEMVGSDHVVNAVSLNSVIVHSSRIVGPAAAAAVIALGGVGPCFLLNALSYVAMIVALKRMDPRQLRTARPARREPGQVRQALRYVAATPGLRLPLVMMAVIGTFSFNFPTVLPLVARYTFGGTATTLSLLTSAMAVGSVVGAFTIGARRVVDRRFLIVSAFAFGGLTAIAALTPTLPLMLAALALTGLASVSFSAAANSLTQLNADPDMRGRVMALYGIVFLGSTPIGAPIAGWVSGAIDPRAGLVLAAVAALATALIAWSATLRAPRDDVAPARTPARA